MLGITFQVVVSGDLGAISSREVKHLGSNVGNDTAGPSSTKYSLSLGFCQTLKEISVKVGS